MIDPTGTAYKTPPDTSAAGKKAAAEKAAADAKKNSAPPPQAAASRPASPTGMRETTVQPAAHRFDLTAAQAWKAALEVRYEDSKGSVEFKKGVARRGGAVASLVDSKGEPWGITQGDLDMDGSDDVVVLWREDRANNPPTWKLALLRNQKGVLYNNHTVDLPSGDGFTNLAVEGNTVTLIPLAGGSNVHVSYSGGGFSVD